MLAICKGNQHHEFCGDLERGGRAQTDSLVVLLRIPTDHAADTGDDVYAGMLTIIVM